MMATFPAIVAVLDAGMATAASRHTARGVRAAPFVRFYARAYRAAMDCAARQQPGSDAHHRARCLAQAYACRHAAWRALAGGCGAWAWKNRQRAAQYSAEALDGEHDRAIAAAGVWFEDADRE